MYIAIIEYNTFFAININCPFINKDQGPKGDKIQNVQQEYTMEHYRQCYPGRYGGSIYYGALQAVRKPIKQTYFTTHR